MVERNGATTAPEASDPTESDHRDDWLPETRLSASIFGMGNLYRIPAHANPANYPLTAHCASQATSALTTRRTTASTR
jgi:hypothetical protein